MREKKLSLLARSKIAEDPSTAGPERDLCQRCKLDKTCQTPYMNPTPPANWTGKLLGVGEAPGADEDERSKRFFSGKAGQLLYKLLVAAGLRVGEGSTPSDATFWNTVRCRPPNNATPTMEQIRCCRPYLLHKIQTLKPLVVLALGVSAIKALTNNGDASVVKSRGRPLKMEE